MSNVIKIDEDYGIALASHQNDSGKWCPKVILREDRKSEVIDVPLFWNKTFSSKEEADKYAILQSKKYIEKKHS